MARSSSAASSAGLPHHELSRLCFVGGEDVDGVKEFGGQRARGGGGIEDDLGLTAAGFSRSGDHGLDRCLELQQDVLGSDESVGVGLKVGWQITLIGAGDDHDRVLAGEGDEDHGDAAAAVNGANGCHIAAHDFEVAAHSDAVIVGADAAKHDDATAEFCCGVSLVGSFAARLGEILRAGERLASDGEARDDDDEIHV
jgi:hypothetical protein